MAQLPWLAPGHLLQLLQFALGFFRLSSTMGRQRRISDEGICAGVAHGLGATAAISDWNSQSSNGSALLYSDSPWRTKMMVFVAMAHDPQPQAAPRWVSTMGSFEPKSWNSHCTADLLSPNHQKVATNIKTKNTSKVPKTSKNQSCYTKGTLLCVTGRLPCCPLSEGQLAVEPEAWELVEQQDIPLQAEPTSALQLIWQLGQNNKKGGWMMVHDS